MSETRNVDNSPSFRYDPTMKADSCFQWGVQRSAKPPFSQKHKSGFKKVTFALELRVLSYDLQGL